MIEQFDEKSKCFEKVSRLLNCHSIFFGGGGGGGFTYLYI